MYLKSRLLFETLDESLYRAIVRAFDLGREQASRQFPLSSVICDALATLALARAWLIRAGAFFCIGFDVAVHLESLSLDVFLPESC